MLIYASRCLDASRGAWWAGRTTLGRSSSDFQSPRGWPRPVGRPSHLWTRGMEVDLRTKRNLEKRPEHDRRNWHRVFERQRSVEGHACQALTSTICMTAFAALVLWMHECFWRTSAIDAWVLLTFEVGIWCTDRNRITMVYYAFVGRLLNQTRNALCNHLNCAGERKLRSKFSINRCDDQV